MLDGVLRKVVTDYDDILKDDSINCVVELMGGVTAAKDVSAAGRGRQIPVASGALLFALSSSW